MPSTKEDAGKCSVGAHVRDAAAYVCWAFARAYPPAVLDEVLKALAPELMTVACYDREVHTLRQCLNPLTTPTTRMQYGLIQDC